MFLASLHHPFPFASPWFLLIMLFSQKSMLFTFFLNPSEYLVLHSESNWPLDYSSLALEGPTTIESSSSGIIVHAFASFFSFFFFFFFLCSDLAFPFVSHDLAFSDPHFSFVSCVLGLAQIYFFSVFGFLSSSLYFHQSVYF